MIEVKFSYECANTASSWEYFCQEMQMVRGLLNFGKLCKMLKREPSVFLTSGSTFMFGSFFR